MQQLTFHLGDPTFTLLHRAGLAGLYMTLNQLSYEGEPAIEGMEWQLSSRQVTIHWKGNDQKALDWLLHQSFQLKDGLIALRGIDSQSMRVDAQVIVHQGILGTFLQHTSTHKAEGVIKCSFSFDGEDAAETQVTYKKLVSYVYQEFANNLCDTQGNLLTKPMSVAGWLNPGAAVRHVAFSADTSFEESPQNAFVLLFAPIACYYYSLRSRLRDKRAQYALVVPEIVDLAEYAKYRQNSKLRDAAYKDFYACGLGDAGLRFLTYETTSKLTRAFSVPRCQVLTLGTVVWANQQKTRTDLYVVEANVKSCFNYEVCCNHLSDRPIKGKDGTFLATSFARELITENLARAQPWYAGAADKVNSKELFQKLGYERGGLYEVIQRIQTDEHEKQFIRTCHEAIYYTYGQLATRTKAGEDPNFDKVTVRFRTGLGRCKNAASFREFITDFWARAGKLPTLKDHWQDLIDFVMQESQWKKSRDLALLALASYPGAQVMRQLLGDKNNLANPNGSDIESRLSHEDQSIDLGWDD